MFKVKNKNSVTKVSVSWVEVRWDYGVVLTEAPSDSRQVFYCKKITGLY